MAVVPVTLFFRQNRQYGIGIITFDLLLNENHNFNNIVTNYYIEDGSSISDHIQNELLTGSLSGLITNFDIFTQGLLVNRAQLAFDQLVELWKSKQLVTIVTVLKVYENVAITNISISRDDTSGEELIANFSFQEVNIVQLQEIQIEAKINLLNMQNDQNKQSSPNLDIGKTTGVNR